MSDLPGQATWSRGNCRPSPSALRRLDSAVRGVLERPSGFGVLVKDVGEVSKPTILTGARGATRVRTGA